MLDIKVDFRDFERRLGAAVTDLKDAAAGALYEEALDIMADSQEHYVPVDEAVLKGSGHVEPPAMTSEEISVTLGYGGPAEAYAIAQHENLEFDHTVGGAKYLERPVLKARTGLASRVTARMRRQLR